MVVAVQDSGRYFSDDDGKYYILSAASLEGFSLVFLGLRRK